MPNPLTAPVGSTVTPSSLTIPNIPIAVDLPSALVAINVIGQAIALLASNLSQVASAQNTSGNSTAGAAASGGTFVVEDQTISTVVLTDPNDSTVAVTVSQVTKLVLRNAVTGESWIWQQPG